MPFRSRHYTSFYCERCGSIRRFTKQCVEHPRHLLATVLTFGLWGIAWYVVSRGEKEEPWRCCKCGHRQMPKDPPEPESPVHHLRSSQVLPQSSTR